MSNRRRPRNLGVDANGCPTETIDIDGQTVVVHHDDIPESDITTIGGLRCTTALRTAIDMATSLDASQFRMLVDDFVSRELFTVEEAFIRIGQPDMTDRRGAHLLGELLVRDYW